MTSTLKDKFSTLQTASPRYSKQTIKIVSNAINAEDDINSEEDTSMYEHL